jgi:hypothetical protein
MKGPVIMAYIVDGKTYVKPSVANLSGEVGKAVMSNIWNAPKSNHSEARRLADECAKAILAEQNDRNSK